jgi:hypothetical protein
VLADRSPLLVRPQDQQEGMAKQPHTVETLAMVAEEEPGILTEGMVVGVEATVVLAEGIIKAEGVMGLATVQGMALLNSSLNVLGDMVVDTEVVGFKAS